MDALLRDHVRAGHLLKLRRGLYTVVPAGADPGAFPVDPCLQASRLAGDAALGDHTALELYGKAHSAFREFHFLTGTAPRPPSLQDCVGADGDAVDEALHFREVDAEVGIRVRSTRFGLWQPQDFNRGPVTGTSPNGVRNRNELRPLLQRRLPHATQCRWSAPNAAAWALTTRS